MALKPGYEALCAEFARISPAIDMAHI